MAVDRSDLRARLVGFLFFLPILLSVLAGAPYAVIGLGLAGFGCLMKHAPYWGQARR